MLDLDMNLLDIFLELLIVVIAAVSLVANSLVLLCFTCSARVRAQVPGLFIINLSFCNILLAVLNMPSTLLAIVKCQKPFGDHFCYTVSFMDTFLTSNTMLSMAALGIDRWIAVVFPLTYSSKMRLKNAVLMVSYVWLHSLAFSLTSLLLAWVDYSPAYASCTLHLRDGDERRGHFTLFTALFHACTFALSLFILFFAYLKVLQVARFHCKRIDVITVQTLLLLVDIHPSVKQRCLVEQKKRRRRAIKKICIFIGSFVLCFAPYVITRLTELAPVKINCHWGIMSKCLVYTKAASDPFVYSLLRQQYKKALFEMCNRILGRNSYTLSGHSSPSGMENEYYTQRVNKLLKDDCH